MRSHGCIHKFRSVDRLAFNQDHGDGIRYLSLVLAYDCDFITNERLFDVEPKHSHPLPARSELFYAIYVH